MVTLEALKRLKLTPEDLRPRFDMTKPLGEKEQALVDRWRVRANAGTDFNLAHYRLFVAIDRAWDAGFFQTTQTLVGMIRELADAKNEAQAISVVNNWKMTHLLAADIDPKTGKPTGRQNLNLPAMYSVIISLARSYTMMRVTRLLNDRLQIPLFKFEPAYQSKTNRAKAEFITQRIDLMNRELGYSALMSQAFQATAMYGQQLMFPMEEYWRLKDYDSELTGGKEGVRFALPHPTRTYFDLDAPTWTLNNESGCSYCGYWKVTRYGALLNTNWWNMDKIKKSTRHSDNAWSIFFETTGQCKLIAGTPQYGSGDKFSTLDREKVMEEGFYNRSMEDQPIWVTEHWEQVHLKKELDDSLPDTSCWFRVVLAGDHTPLYVAAVPYRPVTSWLWEPCDTRAVQSSMVLDVLPWQDHASNIVSQAILSMKQNLANVTLFDEEIVNREDVRRDLENPNEVMYRKLNFWGFSGRKLSKQQGSLDQIFRPFRFPPQNIADHLKLLAEMLNLLERVIGMSAQEVGATATHEQSAEEMRRIHTATGHRADYIGGWLDRGIDAWKDTLYGAVTNYATSESYAYIDKSFTEDALKKAGFTIVESDENGSYVKAPVGNLRGETFISHRDGPSRVNWSEIGNQMVQLAVGFAKAVPPEQIIPLLNIALEASQLPKEFRIKPAPGTPGGEPGAPPPGLDQVKAWVIEQFKAFAEQTKQFVAQATGGGGAPPPPPEGVLPPGIPPMPPGPPPPMPLPMGNGGGAMPLSRVP